MNCPSCHQPMERREHDPGWKPKKGQRYYFQFWFLCTNKGVGRNRCKTTTVCPEEARVTIPREVRQVA